MGSDNLPNKSNFKRFKGLDAITGRSNFDIAEFILLKIINELAREHATVVLLCKTSVARNVLSFVRESNLGISDASIRRIEAKQWFDAAVDACLFTFAINSAQPCYSADIYDSLVATSPQRKIGFVGDLFVADVAAFQDLAPVAGESPVEWRQGVKHDAASVMELVFRDGAWYNKLGEVVEVEDDYIYPLVKSSDLRERGVQRPQRAVIVTQRHVSEDTRPLEHIAPRLWKYLESHTDIFEARKSSIYKGKPPFSIFGVGDYTFAKYKVCVSGLYKQPHFVAVRPKEGKPVLCDDTCYLLPLETAAQAAVVASVLNHPITTRFIRSIAFWDSKRPITKALLNRIDLDALAHLIGDEELTTISASLLRHLGNNDEQILEPSNVIASLKQPQQLSLF